MKKYILLPGLLLLLFFLPLSDLWAAEGSSRMIREQQQLLSQDYAEFRKSQISNVEYTLSVVVEATSDLFSGTAVIDFELAPTNNAPVTIDFDVGEILSLSNNGNAIDWEYEQWFITIPAEQLVTGSNRLVIEYCRPFTTDGDGLHKFTDPENGEIYLYTNFEPYNANRFFPHFDQPNLKAAFTLDVIVPASWQVISNMRETTISENSALNSTTRHWQFPATPAISSYLFSFHAGPFTVWHDQAGEIDLRLFARSTLAEFVNTDEWFIPTQQFMAFFQEYFEVPYPLNKYDQIIVPDFNPGAMENIGAVTFNEAYVSRGEKSILELNRLAYVIAHEMAHMWFGDLVTMNWWDDLWLNESFATYMGYLALEEASDFNNSWDIFYSRGKTGAYRADARVTTHPIALAVANTDEAFANFDAITYQKGSSVLKQLPYFIGEENFRRGVSNYLKEHSFSNATLDDFVAALSQSSGMDLTQWKQEWLLESGANTIKADFSCTEGRIVNLRLLQSVPDAPGADKVLRSQRTLIGFYRYTDNQMVLGSTLAVSYSGAETSVPEATGNPCPDMLFPNENDHAYFEFTLDDVSRITLNEHINDFVNPTTRLMLWNSLWTGVREARISLDDFINFAFPNIALERNDDVIRQVSGNLAAAFNYYTSFGDHESKRLEIQDFIWQQLNNAEAGSEIQKIWYGNFTNRAHTESALDYLLSLLDGDENIAGIEIDQDKRWDIIYTMNRYAYGNYQVLLDSEAVMDSSDQGINTALASQSIRPDLAVKEGYLAMIFNDPDRYKLATLRAIMFSLYPNEQSALFESVAEQILAALPSLNESASERFLDAYVELLPATCTQASVTRLEQASIDYRNFRPVISKRGLEILQEDQRCVTLKELVSN